MCLHSRGKFSPSFRCSFCCGSGLSVSWQTRRRLASPRAVDLAQTGCAPDQTITPPPHTHSLTNTQIFELITGRISMAGVTSGNCQQIKLSRPPPVSHPRQSSSSHVDGEKLAPNLCAIHICLLYCRWHLTLPLCPLAACAPCTANVDYLSKGMVRSIIYIPQKNSFVPLHTFF